SDLEYGENVAAIERQLLRFVEDDKIWPAVTRKFPFSEVHKVRGLLESRRSSGSSCFMPILLWPIRAYTNWKAREGVSQPTIYRLRRAWAPSRPAPQLPRR